MPSFLLHAALAASLCCAGSAFAHVTLAAADTAAAGGTPQTSAPAREAPVDVSHAWARATVPGQGGTGAFMTLQAATALKLVGVSSPVAGVAQVHEMKMEGSTMHMREMAALELPAHQSVALTPGGYHLMLMDLKQPLAAGSQVTLTLYFTDAKGAPLQRTLQLPVRTTAPDGAGGGAMHRSH